MEKLVSQLFYILHDELPGTQTAQGTTCPIEKALASTASLKRRTREQTQGLKRHGTEALWNRGFMICDVKCIQNAPTSRRVPYAVLLQYPAPL